MKLSKIIMIAAEAREVLNDVEDFELRYELFKLLKQIEPEVELYEKTRTEVIVKIGTKIEGTEEYKVEEKDYEEFNKTIKPIMDKEIKLKPSLPRDLFKNLKSKKIFLLMELIK